MQYRTTVILLNATVIFQSETQYWGKYQLLNHSFVTTKLDQTMKTVSITDLGIIHTYLYVWD